MHYFSIFSSLVFSSVCNFFIINLHLPIHNIGEEPYSQETCQTNINAQMEKGQSELQINSFRISPLDNIPSMVTVSKKKTQKMCNLPERLK